MKHLLFEKGQSLFEVVVAVGISALIVTGIVVLSANSIQNSSFSRDKTLASLYVQQAMEWIRKERDQNSDVFRTKATYDQSNNITYCLNDLSWPNTPGNCASESFVDGDTKFVRKVTFPACNPCPPNIIEVNVTVSWMDSKGNHDVSSSTNFSMK